MRAANSADELYNSMLCPWKIFGSCVGDLATLGGSVGRDLGPATPLVRSPPPARSRGVGGCKVLLWQLHCAMAELSF